MPRLVLGAHWHRVYVSPRCGQLLRAALKAKGLEHEEFAHMAGVSPSTLRKSLYAERRPVVHEVERWARILKLSQVETDTVVEAAYLAHCPEWVEKRYLAMRAAITPEALRKLLA